MRYLVVGDGSRESAILWCLQKDPRVTWTGRISAKESWEESAREAKAHKATVIIGPDNPLAEGLADRLWENDIRVFGPSREAARIVWSKSFAKRLMWVNDIPTAPAHIFSNSVSALEYAGRCELPIVIKADGLALGKGVRKAYTHEQAREIVRDFMERRVFGEAGEYHSDRRGRHWEDSPSHSVGDGRLSVRQKGPFLSHHGTDYHTDRSSR